MDPREGGGSRQPYVARDANWCLERGRQGGLEGGCLEAAEHGAIWIWARMSHAQTNGSPGRWCQAGTGSSCDVGMDSRGHSTFESRTRWHRHVRSRLRNTSEEGKRLFPPALLAELPSTAELEIEIDGEKVDNRHPQVKLAVLSRMRSLRYGELRQFGSLEISVGDLQPTCMGPEDRS